MNLYPTLTLPLAGEGMISLKRLPLVKGAAGRGF
tara:strand:+ start:16853 stop:16954 length:102 start_codon:yes stop_codon:yes gene_type:complete